MGQSIKLVARSGDAKDCRRCQARQNWVRTCAQSIRRASRAVFGL